MGIKKTNEKFLEELANKNPNFIPLEKYQGNKVNILCRCKICNKTNAIRPSNLLSGKGCKYCSQKRIANLNRKSKEDFIADLAMKNFSVELIGEYINGNTNTLFKCRLCDYEWFARPNHELAGHGCPVCGGSKKKTKEQFVDELAKINPYVVVLGEYVNAKTHIKCKCLVCSNEWNTTTPDKLLQGNGCPNCDKRNKTSFSEQAIFFYMKKVFSDAISRCTNIDGISELDIYIPSKKIGIEYDGFWHKADSKQNFDMEKYRLCKEKGVILYRIRENKFSADDSLYADYVIYRSNPQKIESLENCIYKLCKLLALNIDIDLKRDAFAIRKQYYTKIQDKSIAALFPKIANEWDYELNVGITPEMVFAGSNDLYNWVCAQGHKWKAAPCDRTIAGKGCKVCAHKSTAKKLTKSNESFLNELKKINPNIKVTEQYKTTHVPLSCICLVCGHGSKEIWKASPANLLRGRKCPKCSKKEAAKKISKTKKGNH